MMSSPWAQQQQLPQHELGVPAFATQACIICFADLHQASEEHRPIVCVRRCFHPPSLRVPPPVCAR